MSYSPPILWLAPRLPLTPSPFLPTHQRVSSPLFSISAGLGGLTRLLGGLNALLACPYQALVALFCSITIKLDMRVRRDTPVANIPPCPHLLMVVGISHSWKSGEALLGLLVYLQRSRKYPGGSHSIRFSETLILSPGVSSGDEGLQTPRVQGCRCGKHKFPKWVTGNQGEQRLSYFYLLVPRWNILPLEDISSIIAIGLRMPGTLPVSLRGHFNQYQISLFWMMWFVIRSVDSVCPLLSSLVIDRVPWSKAILSMISCW